MRPRNLLLVLLLGTVVAVLPAMASSETTPTVNATGGEYTSMSPVAWTPSQVTIGAGGSVTFANHSTEVPHGVIWTSAVKPTCNGVPSGLNSYNWSGSCTFAQAGEYTFECSVHGREMTGKIIVNAAGTTTTMSAPVPTPIPTTTTPPTTPKPVTVTHLTRAQKLAKALKACKKKPKGKRAACRKRAHKRYGHH